MPWFVWLIIAVMALAGEVVSTAFVLVYVGVAAAITAVLAFAGVPALAQFVVFIPLTLLLLRVVRPQTIAMLGMNKPKLQLNSGSALVDRIGYVEEVVTDSGGMVRLGNGEFWSARAYPPGILIPQGTRVRIMFIQGISVYVSTVTESGRLPDLPADAQPDTPDFSGE